MVRPRVGVPGRIAGFLAGLALITPCLFSAPAFKDPKIKPEKGYLIRIVPYEKWLAMNNGGPACLAMVPNDGDETRSFSQRKIAVEIYDPESRANYSYERVLYSLPKGFESYAFQEDLRVVKDVVAKDIPVIILAKTIKKLAKGQSRMVIGFNDDRDDIIFHDPFFGKRHAMTSGDFMKAWELGLSLHEGGHPRRGKHLRAVIGLIVVL